MNVGDHPGELRIALYAVSVLIRSPSSEGVFVSEALEGNHFIEVVSVSIIAGRHADRYTGNVGSFSFGPFATGKPFDS